MKSRIGLFAFVAVVNFSQFPAGLNWLADHAIYARLVKKFIASSYADACPINLLNFDLGDNQLLQRRAALVHTAREDLFATNRKQHLLQLNEARKARRRQSRAAALATIAARREADSAPRLLARRPATAAASSDADPLAQSGDHEEPEDLDRDEPDAEADEYENLAAIMEQAALANGPVRADDDE